MPSPFAADTGAATVTNGALVVSATGDAATISYDDRFVPTYYEVVTSLKASKNTGGTSANAYVLFDYYGPNDFKFAGINATTGKVEMGHRTATGWIFDAQTTQTIKTDTYYGFQVTVNGTSVSALIGGKSVLTYSFSPRVVDGVQKQLNTGLIGVGANGATASFDNVDVQTLPPQYTLDYLEDFSDGVANLFTGASTGTWAVQTARYNGTPLTTDYSAYKMVDLGTALAPSSYLDVLATLKTDSVGGLVYDYNGPDDMKFVAMDAKASRIYFGHRINGKWIIDSNLGKAIISGLDYKLEISLRGGTVSATVNGTAVANYTYASTVVDGAFGLLTRRGANADDLVISPTGGNTSYDDVRIRTDDPAFAAPARALAIAGGPGAGGARILESSVAPLLAQASERWSSWLAAAGGAAAPGLFGGVRVAVANLSGSILGETVGTTIYLDEDAAGHGWDVIDPVDVLSHELGHAMGLDHDAADEFGVMAPTRSANATTYWIPVSIALPPVVTTVAPMPSRGAVASVAAERPPHSRMTVSAITPVALIAGAPLAVRPALRLLWRPALGPWMPLAAMRKVRLGGDTPRRVWLMFS